jgi:flagellar motor switch protein FliN
MISIKGLTKMPETAQATEQSEQQDVQTPEYPQAVDSPSGAPVGSLDMLLDVPMAITVSLGGTEIPIHQLLQIAPGSVIQLDRSIDEPADLYVRDIKFATGDIVVVDGRFAIKIKQIISNEPAKQTAS